MPQLKEIVVTGTRIRGASPAAPVHTVTRDDIEQSGHSQIGDVIRGLPQIFAGGQNPGVQIGASGSSNLTNSSTINLRGLGNDATLVLVNGNRLVPDAAYPAPDISAIPLSAIQRVEIVTDGSSALYGADAVAGVANLILRRNFDGVELGARVGGATQGGGLEQAYNAAVGRMWDGGYALIAAENYHQDAILAPQRRITSTMAPANALLRANNRNSLFASGEVALSSLASLRFDGLYSERQSGFQNQSTPTAAVRTSATDVTAFFFAPQVNLRLPGGWDAAIGATYSRSTDENREFTSAGATSSQDWRNKARSIEATISGGLLELPSGSVQLAAGLGYRDEAYRFWTHNTTQQPGAREVSYAFAELLVPLVEPSPTRTGLNQLELSVAGRFEDYSDFGDVAVPKVGVRYVPFSDLTIRGTWGKSFKAPSYSQMLSATTAFIYPTSSLGSTTPGQGIVLFGGQRNLLPERSTNWTAGFDWSPARLEGFDLSLTYYVIDYTDRVVNPISPLGQALSNPIFAPYITWNPTPEQQAAAIASTDRTQNLSPSPYDTASVIAIVDSFYVNATAQEIDGVDLALRYRFDSPVGEFTTFATASWLTIMQQTLPAEAPVERTGTLFQPPDLRARAGLTWHGERVTLTGIVNYVGGGTDTNVTPHEDISSWTTVDLNVAYRFGDRSDGHPRAELIFAVNNLLDKDPPLARGAALRWPGVLYDSTNTSAVGQFVSAALRLRF